MLKKEYKKLHKELKKLTQCFESIYDILDAILLNPSMDLTISIRNESFVFFPPTTQQEFESLMILRDKFIKLLLTEQIHTYINSATDQVIIEEQFKDIFALVQVEDPKMFQVKKKYKVNISDVDTSVASKALNFDSFYVQNDLKGEHVKPI